jgi:hypothetical protein
MSVEFAPSEADAFMARTQLLDVLRQTFATEDHNVGLIHEVISDAAEFDTPWLMLRGLARYPATGENSDLRPIEIGRKPFDGAEFFYISFMNTQQDRIYPFDTTGLSAETATMDRTLSALLGRATFSAKDVERAAVKPGNIGKIIADESEPYLAKQAAFEEYYRQLQAKRVHTMLGTIAVALSNN